MNRDPIQDLKEELRDPELAAHFANAQAESSRELLRCGVIKSLTSASLSNKTIRSKRWMGERWG